MMHIIFRLSIGVVLVSAGFVALSYDAHAAKLIENGWDSPRTPEELRDVVAPTEDRQPHDGTVLRAPYGTVSRDEFFTLSQYQSWIDTFKSIQHAKFKDNFLHINLAGKAFYIGGAATIEWYNDAHWNNILNNIGIMARVAKEGGFGGILLDPEDYSQSQYDTQTSPSGLAFYQIAQMWNFAYRPDKGTKTYDEYYAKVQSRGVQFIQAINAEFPNVDVITYWCFEAPNVYAGDASARYALLSAFCDGMIQGADAGTVIHDATENAYSAGFQGNESSFIALKNQLKSQAQTKSSNPARLEDHYKVGFGIWMVPGGGGYYSTTPVSRWLSVLTAALKHSEGYVWAYSEQVNFRSGDRINWWTGVGIPQSYIDATFDAVSAVDSIPPSVPTSLTTTVASPTKVSLSWSPSSDNAGVQLYKIYRDGAPIGTASGASYQDDGALSQTTYSYTVLAQDAAGNVSSKSNTSSVTTPPLSPPSGLTATAASSTHVNLSWNASSDDTRIAGYRLFKNGVQIADLVNATPTSPSYANPGGKGNRTSFIRVSDSGSMFNGNAGMLVNGSSGNADNNFWAQANDGQPVVNRWITFDFGAGASKVISEVTWYQHVTANHGIWKLQGSNDNNAWSDLGPSFSLGDVATQIITAPASNTRGYRYYRLIGVSGTFSYSPYLREIEFKIGDAPPPPTTYQDSAVTPGTTYSYTVVAYDVAGSGSPPTNAVLVATLALPDTTPPSIPSDVRATAVSAERVDLTWSASSDNKGVSGYRLYRNGVLATSEITGTSYQDSGLSPNTKYVYSISAFDNAGNVSEKSGVVEVETIRPIIVDRILPISGPPGSSFVVSGSGLQGASVIVRGERVAPLESSADGSSLTFKLPAGTPAGSLPVSVSNDKTTSNDVAITVSPLGSIRATVGPLLPRAVSVPAGAHDVPLGTIQVSTESEGISLSQFGLRFTGQPFSSFSRFVIWDGIEKVAEGVPQENVTVSFEQLERRIIPAGGVKVFTITGDFSESGESFSARFDPENVIGVGERSGLTIAANGIGGRLGGTVTARPAGTPALSIFTPKLNVASEEPVVFFLTSENYEKSELRFICPAGISTLDRAICGVNQVVSGGKQSVRFSNSGSLQATVYARFRGFDTSNKIADQRTVLVRIAAPGVTESLGIINMVGGILFGISSIVQDVSYQIRDAMFW